MDLDSWDNIDAILPLTNKISVVGDLREKYKVGKRVKVRGTISSDGKYRLTVVVFVAQRTQMTVAGDLTEDSAGTGQIRPHKPYPY